MTPPPPAARSGPIALVAIGSSTGGTEALRVVLPALPADCPPLVVAQHIPRGFSSMLAEHLDRICSIRVREAADGDPLRPGQCLICPGGSHLFIQARGVELLARVRAGRPEDLYKPSVNILFHSVVAAAGPRALGVLLTGMGQDGAQGLLALKKAGAFTIAQDEASSVVYGMPRAAAEIGAACRVLPLGRIPELIAYLSRRAAASQPGSSGSSSRRSSKE